MWAYELALPRPGDYTGQKVHVSLDGYEPYDMAIAAWIQGYRLYMNPPPHVLTGLLCSTRFGDGTGLTVEILDGPNAGRRTTSYAYSGLGSSLGAGAYALEQLQPSPPFRLRIGNLVYLFEGVVVRTVQDWFPVAGLYHHSEFSPC